MATKRIDYSQVKASLQYIETDVITIKSVLDYFDLDQNSYDRIMHHLQRADKEGVLVKIEKGRWRLK